MAEPTTQNVYQAGFPAAIAPYAEDLVKQAATFTDITKNPYQQYTGERVAQLSPLVQQAMANTVGMDVAGQIGAGTTLAGASGLSALAPTSFTDRGTADSYMTPFMRGVTDAQIKEAQRQAAIQKMGIGAAAAKAGAFGGGRHAIERAEANRNLQTQLGNIQAQGLQNAFQNAQQQYNTERNQQLQGAQTGIQAASVLGTLGGQQEAQQKDIINLQNQLGMQEQQRAQSILDAQYQDFLNYQNYPYKQMGFMSDIIRGVPLMQTSGTVYQAGPSSTQNMLSTGLGVAGIANLLGYQPGRKDGGAIKEYANGGAVKSYGFGGSVFSPAFKDYAIKHIDPRQLPMAQQNAITRGDNQTAMEASDQIALNDAIRRGIASAAPEDMDQGYADGGIVAFSKGGRSWEDYSSDAIKAAKAPEESADQYTSNVRDRAAGMAALYGPSKVAPLYEEQAGRYEKRMQQAQQMGLGTTLLRMAAALQKSGVTSSDRYAGMFSEAASGAEKAESLRAAAEDQLLKSKLAMAQAEQAYGDRNIDKAVAAKGVADERAMKGRELEVRAMDTAAQVAGNIERERMQGDTQRAIASRASEQERAQARFEQIASGTAQYLGKTGPEAAKQFLADNASVATSRAGERGTKELERSLAIESAIRKDPRFVEATKTLSLLQLSGAKDKKTQEKIAKVEADMKAVTEEYTSKYGKYLMGDGDGGGAGAGGGGGAKPITRAEYDKLPSGATFTAPDGSTRIKP